jgi:hypothetical protein
MGADTNQRPPCVVIDTNIWRRTLMLRSPLGIALIYAIRQYNSKIGLPEVIEREVEKHGVEVGLEAVTAAKEAQRKLERLLDKRVSFSLPREIEIRDNTKKRLDQLGPLFERVPLTLDQVRMALDRVNLGLAPSGKHKDYKDSLIWEATLELATRFQVFLVTEDSGFFRQGELEPSLQQECEQGRLSIRGFQNLEAYLRAFAPTIPATYSDEIRDKIKASLREWSEQKLAEAGHDGRVTKGVDLQLFATEEPSRFALLFTTEGNVMPGTPGSADHEAEGGTFELQASGLVDITDGSILDLGGSRIEIIWKAPHFEEGRLVWMSNIIHSGGLKFVGLGPTLEAIRDTNWIRLRENE